MHEETWGPFGRGWSNELFEANEMAPGHFPLIAYPKAWTSGTNGPVTADAIFAKIEKEEDFASYRGRLRGKFVLTAPLRAASCFLGSDPKWSIPMKPINWDIRREGRLWSHEEFDERINQAPEKIEYVNGIFASNRERLIVLGMLLENLGIDRVVQFGRLEDWKAAIDDLEKKHDTKRQP